jgi:hypothetical protein
MVSTEAFWGKMCDLRFRRLSRLSGAVGVTVFVTLEAPEDVPGFLESVIDGIRTDLRIDRPQPVGFWKFLRILGKPPKRPS